MFNCGTPMGIKVNQAPDDFVSKLEDSPKGWISGKEAQEKFKAGEERKFQAEVANYLVLHRIYFRKDRMDKKTRGKQGEPDFIVCYRGRFLGIECKTIAGKMSGEQVKAMADIIRSGGSFCMAKSLSDVQGVLRQIDAEMKNGQ
jgi:Nuclease-related domain